jgi:hypothetical protein
MECLKQLIIERKTKCLDSKLKTLVTYKQTCLTTSIKTEKHFLNIFLQLVRKCLYIQTMVIKGLT